MNRSAVTLWFLACGLIVGTRLSESLSGYEMEFTRYCKLILFALMSIPLIGCSRSENADDVGVSSNDEQQSELQSETQSRTTVSVGDPLFSSIERIKKHGGYQYSLGMQRPSKTDSAKMETYMPEHSFAFQDGRGILLNFNIYSSTIEQIQEIKFNDTRTKADDEFTIVESFALPALEDTESAR